MAEQFTHLLEVFKALENQNVDYILIGGVAVIFYGMERLTRDIDIFIKMNTDQLSQRDFQIQKH